MAKKKTTRRGAEFPLWLHESSGQWCKTIRGTRHHFGTDQDKALDRYLKDKDHLIAGKTPPCEGYTVRDLLNAYLEAQEAKVSAGDLKPRSFDLNKSSCDRIARELKKTSRLDHIDAGDLERLKASCSGNATTRANEIGRIRSVLKFAFDAGLIERPIRLAALKKPPAKSLRMARRERTSRLLTPQQIHSLLSLVADEPQLRAMLLLGINCGMGANDCGALVDSALDLEEGWLDWWRPKTAMPRLAKLWPETCDALRIVLEGRKKPKDAAHESRVFITRYGHPWVREEIKQEKAKLRVLYKDSIGQAFTRLFCTAEIKQERDGLGFYCFRHCFATIADQVGDKDATRMAMGLLNDDVANQFCVEEFARGRLEKVANHVHVWLFGRKKKSRGRQTRDPVAE
jgi:integrase